MDGRVGGWVVKYARTNGTASSWCARTCSVYVGAHAQSHTSRLARTPTHRLRALPARVGRRDDVMLEGKEQHRR